ncbi:MAG: hypothetical protein AAF479_15210 [Pseudomonadota bacterium]
MTTALKFSRYAVVTAILAAIIWLVIQHNGEQRRVLIVHSYYKDLAWVSELNDGVRTALDKIKRDERRNLNVRTHYMDLRNHPDCNYFKLATEDVRYTVKEWEPDVIVIFDDLAQGLVGFNQLRFNDTSDQGAAKRDTLAEELAEWLKKDRCDAPEFDVSYFGLDRPAESLSPDIIFAGVNGTSDRYGYEDASNVTGIYERKNYRAIVEKLEVLRDAYGGQVSGIRLLNDTSATASAESRVYRSQSWDPFKALTPVQVSSFDAWKAQVRKANAENVMLLIANYDGVKHSNGEPVQQHELISWTEREAKLPVLGLNTRFVADGGMMTIAISGTEQGSVAIEMAMDSIRGQPLRKQQAAKQYTIGLNQSLVRQRKLELPSVYRAFSDAVGKFIDVIEHLYLEQSDLKKNELNEDN